MRFRSGVGLAISAMSIVACTSGSDLAPPTNVTMQSPFLFDSIEVRWTRPPGSIDGFEIQGRVGNGAWELWPERISPEADGVYVTMKPGVLELVTLGVQVRSVKGDRRSGWSTEATLFRSVAPPSRLTATASSTAIGLRVTPVHLEWENVSQVATSFQIERFTQGSPGDGQAIPVATVDVSASNHDDDGATEAYWTYRIRAGAEGVWGPWTLASPVTVDLAPPRDVRAAREPGLVRVTWTNRSSIAAMHVSRIDPGGYASLIATLPIGAHEYADPVEAPWPATRYEVAAFVPESPWIAAGDAPVPVGAFSWTGAITLDASARTVPQGGSVAFTDEGRIHVAGDSGAWVFAIARDTGADRDVHALAGATSFIPPGILADASGNPHTAFFTGYPDRPDTELVHEWFDGSAWRREVVVTAPGPEAVFGVAGDGTLHVLGSRREVSGAYTTVHHVAAAGTVNSTDLVATVLPPSPSGQAWYDWSRSLSVAPDGTAWMVLTYSAPPLANTDFVVFRRSSTGTWGQELAPPSGGYGTASVVAGSAESGALLFDESVRVRTASGWGPAESPGLPYEGMTRLGAALSPDGARMLLLVSRYPDGVWLSIRGASGWDAALLASPSSGGSPAFGVDGRARVVAPHTIPGGEMWVSVFVERR
jgi:hypothetical protein